MTANNATAVSVIDCVTANNATAVSVIDCVTANNATAVSVMGCVQGGSKLERARDLFEQCLDGCPAKFAKGTPLSVPVVLCLSVPVVLFYLYLVEAIYLKA